MGLMEEKMQAETELKQNLSDQISFDEIEDN